MRASRNRWQPSAITVMLVASAVGLAGNLAADTVRIGWRWWPVLSWAVVGLTLLVAVSVERASHRKELLAPAVPPPRVWNVRSRSSMFTGRDGLLTKLHESLREAHPTAVTALYGMGGVGKTQLAMEYAHRYAGDYELVWWIDAERHALVADQLAGLAVEAGLVAAGTDTPAAIQAARGHLRGHDRWLVVFDNAVGSEDVAQWLPQGPGHVIITSRSHVWTGVATALPVDVFTRAESVAFLAGQVGHLDTPAADELAGQLGDLPLALAQAAGVMIETGMPGAEYLGLLSAGVTLAAGVPVGYPVSLATSVRLAVDAVSAVDPVTGDLMRLCSLMGPAPIPLWLLAAGTSSPLPAEGAASQWQLRQCVGRAGRYGLMQAGPDTVTMHRLTQAVIRDNQPAAQRDVNRDAVEALLVTAMGTDDDGANPASWPRWAQLLPHLLHADPGASDNRQLMDLARSAIYSLYARGDLRTALPIARDLHARLRERFGDDDPDVLAAALNLSTINCGLGQYEQSRQLDAGILARSRRLLGEDHLETLLAASNLALDLRALGEYEQAAQLGQDAMDRCRKNLGEDNDLTLAVSTGLAVSLRRLGRQEDARQLNMDVLRRCEQKNGRDHPDTLVVAINLGNDLRELGLYAQARDLNMDTLERCRQVLGADHVDTLGTATNLAADLRALGDVVRARDLDEDTLSRCRRTLGEDHPLTLEVAANLAAE